jgi:hypothetical protein
MSTRATTQPATSLTLARPSGLASGDVMLAVVDTRLYASSAISGPSGWTLVRRDSSTSNGGLSQAVYVRVAGPAEPSSYTWSWGSSVSAAGAILAYTGVDATSPVLASSGLVTFDTRSIRAPSVTTSVSGAAIVGLWANNGRTDTAAPDGLTKRFELETSGSTRDITLMGADTIQASAGAAGDLVASSNATNQVAAGQLVALRPSGSTSSPSPSPTPPPPAPVAPTSTAPPAVSGSVVAGSTLSATPGSWSGTTPISYTYQWRSCDSAGANCASIASAVSPSFTLTSAEVGKTIRVLVTATNAAGSASAVSAASAVVASPVSAPAPPPPSSGGLLFTDLVPYASGGGSVQSPAAGLPVDASAPAWGIARWHHAVNITYGATVVIGATFSLKQACNCTLLRVENYNASGGDYADMYRLELDQFSTGKWYVVRNRHKATAPRTNEHTPILGPYPASLIPVGQKVDVELEAKLSTVDGSALTVLRVNGVEVGRTTIHNWSSGPWPGSTPETIERARYGIIQGGSVPASLTMHDAWFLGAGS